MPDTMVADLHGWAVVLDLGNDERPTELDALYVQAALATTGIETLFYPWDPRSDVLTPLGAVRPYRLLVPEHDEADAAALAADVLSDRGPRRDVLVPTDDPWVLGYNWRVIGLHLRDRMRERGGIWILAWRVFVVVAVVGFGGQLVLAAVSAAMTLFQQPY